MFFDTQSFQFLILGIAAAVFIFPIETKNLLIMIFKRKDYVVCHVFRTATRKPVTILAVPNVKADFQTRIWKKKTYNLHPEYSAFEDQNRLHFLILEESNLPLKSVQIEPVDANQVFFKYRGKIYLNSEENVRLLKFEPWTKNDILIGADEVDTGINAKSHNILHGDQTHWAMIFALAAVLVAVITAWYSYQQIQDISPLIQVIYQKVQPQNITIMP